MSLSMNISGGVFTENIRQEILLQTGRARLLVDSVVYSEADGILSFRIRRAPLRTVKRNYFGIDKPVYGKDFVNTSFRAKNITQCTVQNYFRDSQAECFILLGISIKENSIVVSSAEEERGETLFLLDAKFTELDLHFEDIEDE